MQRTANADASVDVAPGTAAIYTDVACGWSTVAIHRFRERRRALGLDGRVRLDHRLFLLEDVNRAPLDRRLVDSEISVLGTLAPGLGWRIFADDPSAWPVSSLLANEAVHAAKAQGHRAAEELDWALRMALFRDGRCITMRHVVLDVAGDCDAVDADAIGAALDDGRARGPMMAGYRSGRSVVQGSPHIFLADGSDVHNPGIALHWEGEPGRGYPVIDADDADVYDDSVRRAAAVQGAAGG
jgi:predicted DsbA family dithiol-disulfide isomerase